MIENVIRTDFLFISIVFICCIAIQTNESLKCYSYRGNYTKTNFNRSKNEIIYGNDMYDVCSLTKYVGDYIRRDLIPASICRSSSYQFCCNHDLCNSLVTPPLPALTNRSCMIGTCSLITNQCNHSRVYLSSATESCSITFEQKNVYYSYRKECLSKNKTLCCNSNECHRQNLSTNIELQCYTCDSRITGFESCLKLNESSRYVYRATTSSRSESCATVVGLSNEDYPTFIIRTFIDNCINQSLGNVTYAGARFQGRIDCCATSFCNKNPFDMNSIDSQETVESIHHIKLIVVIFTLSSGGVFMLIGITISIYRFLYYKSRHPHNFSVVANGENVALVRTN